MRTRNLSAHHTLRPYQRCPDCRSRYTVDKDSKRRALLIALFALLLALLSGVTFLAGWPWGFASLFGGVVLLAYVGHTLSKIIYVEYRDGE